MKALASHGCAGAGSADAEGADGFPQELGEACDVAGVQRQLLPPADRDLQLDVGHESELADPTVPGEAARHHIDQCLFLNSPATKASCSAVKGCS
ncbi:hypothetical protein OG802_35040 [Streptomyces sp. NBC_00704]|uniref:hypothetical protein n=1 Tax=Streptomyces sp. NBC_00704 TaxID=2975809 RepID=UPI002E37772F|nr:hypothetical protein [Streptomyces sp. NBC_00704]